MELAYNHYQKGNKLTEVNIMKRWKGLLIAAVCIVGSCYVGDVGAAALKFTPEECAEAQRVANTHDWKVFVQKHTQAEIEGTNLGRALAVCSGKKVQQNKIEDVSMASANDIAQLVVRNIGKPSDYQSKEDLRTAIGDTFNAIVEHTNIDTKTYNDAYDIVLYIYGL
jgi:hypothetical protein